MLARELLINKSIKDSSGRLNNEKKCYVLNVLPLFGVLSIFLCKIPLKVLSVRNCWIVGHVVVFF
jgi:hypothetical protein